MVLLLASICIFNYLYFNYSIFLYEKFIITIILNLLLKISYWILIRQKTDTNIQTAVGIKSKNISFFEGPHTGKNYLTTEMINKSNNKNNNLLRLTFCILTFINLYMINQYSTLIADQFILKLSMIFVFILALVGMIIERYLFFIQSKHVVGLYYGN